MLPLFLCPQNGRSGTTSAGSSVFPVPRAGGFPVMRQGCVLPLALPSSPKNVLPGLPLCPAVALCHLESPWTIGRTHPAPSPSTAADHVMQRTYRDREEPPAICPDPCS